MISEVPPSSEFRCFYDWIHRGRVTITRGSVKPFDLFHTVWLCESLVVFFSEAETSFHGRLPALVLKIYFELFT